MSPYYKGGDGSVYHAMFPIASAEETEGPIRAPVIVPRSCDFCGEPLHAVDTYCCPGCGWKVSPDATDPDQMFDRR